MSQKFLTEQAITVAAPGVISDIGPDQEAVTLFLDNTSGTGVTAIIEGSPNPGADAPDWYGLQGTRTDGSGVDGGGAFAVTDAVKRAWVVETLGVYGSVRLRLTALTGSATVQGKSVAKLVKANPISVLATVNQIAKTIAAATGTAIPVTDSGSLAITQNGAETNTLADPTFRGQTLSIFVDTDTSGARVITAASRINQAANTIITMTEVGDFIKLEAITIAGALKWQVVANDGCVLS